MKHISDPIKRKSVHVHMTTGVHSEFKSNVAKVGLSMQEVLEECAIRIAAEDSYMEKILNELIIKKSEGAIRIAEKDAESIYRIISDE